MITNTVTRLLLAVAVLAAATLAAPHGHAALMARFAKQLGVHPRKIGKQLLARATSAIEKGERTTPTLRAAAAGGSKDYAAIYMHASPNCTDSPFVAMAVRADTCFNVGSGNNALSYYTSCVSGDGLTLSIHMGKDCKNSNHAIDVSLYAEATCTDTLTDDDFDDDFDDDDFDDDLDFETFFSVECTNNIRSEFTSGPATATYLGPNCQGDWFQATMFPVEDCRAIDDSFAYSAVCGAESLDVAFYDNDECTGEPEADHYPTAVCLNDEDTDDDDGDDDDGDDDDGDDDYDDDDGGMFTGSSYTACHFDDLPSDSAAALPMMANWALLLVSAILGLQLAAF